MSPADGTADGGQPGPSSGRPRGHSESPSTSSSSPTSCSASPTSPSHPRDTHSSLHARNDSSPFLSDHVTPSRSRYLGGDLLGAAMDLEGASPSPYSPTASIALERASQTLAGLGRQLTELNMGESDADISARCCCCKGHECAGSAGRGRSDAKLKLCGEIGTALLQRCEALELKHTRAENQIEIKRKALADSLRHVANLERANSTHLTKYAELSHAFEVLEKKYTQAQHSQTLTQQSLTHVRTELARSRASASMQSAAGAGAEERVADAERRFEDTRDLLAAESRRLREANKWRQMAEERIGDLEAKLTASGRELEDLKTARARDAQELLANAKERLEALHTELSETFHADAPSDMPEYQRTLEDLVATNALLKHDTSELAVNLAEKMEENRALREEIEEMKASARATPPDPQRPLSVELRPLLMAKHTRTGSSPVVGNEAMRPMHARMASAALPHHRRQSSLAPSFTSTSTTEGPSVTSPSPDDGSPIVRAVSNPASASISPEQRRSNRSSFSGGIPYTINGVVKSKRPSVPRNPSRRSVQVGGSLADLAEGDTLVDADVDATAPYLGDRSADFSADMGSTTDDASDSQSEVSRRKRASVLLPTTMSPKTGPSPLLDGGSAFDLPAAYPAAYPSDKRIGRRTLLLLSRSTGVQTDPLPTPPIQTIAETPEPPLVTSPAASPYTPLESPITSTQHSRSGSRIVSTGSATPAAHTLGELVDFLTKILLKLHGVQVRTLNGRLKKHNLPGDVGHVSRTTIATLRVEVDEMRHKFRHVLEATSSTRRDMGLLLKLLKDVFSDLLELQGIVNDVTVNPKLAKQLRAKAFADDAATPAAPVNPLGWIAAPLTNWLTAPAQAPVSPTPKRPAPKLQASTSASTTTVSVEFGSAGTIRRAAPATPKKTNVTAVVGAADVFGDPTSTTTNLQPDGQRSVSAAVTGSERQPPSPRRHASMAALGPARRSELMGIFAGGAAPRAGAPRTLRDASPAQGPGRVRHASSQYFGSRPVRSAVPSNRLSTIVDAVLDPDPSTEDFEPALTRTLRPRGLSDSSIRSAVIPPPPAALNDLDSDGFEPVSLPQFIPSSSRYSVGTVAALAESLGSGMSFGSLQSFGRRMLSSDTEAARPANPDLAKSVGPGKRPKRTHEAERALPPREPETKEGQDAKEQGGRPPKPDSDAEAEFETTPRPRRIRPRSSAEMRAAKRASLKKSAEQLAQKKASAEHLQPRPTASCERLRSSSKDRSKLRPTTPTENTPSITPTATLRAPRTPSRPALAPSLAIPATVNAGTSPVESGAGDLLERLAENADTGAAPGLRSLSLKGSVRVAGRKWR